MDKELVAKTQNAVSTDVMSDWGEGPALGQDIVIAKILPMQASSHLVGDGKAAIGDYRDSLTGAKIGSIVEPIEVIPFHVEKFWDIQKDVDGSGQFKWVRSEPLIEDPVSPGYNDNLPWKDKEDGEEIKRIRRMNFYVLLPSEVAGGSDVPYIFSFKSTSFKEGKKVFTQMYMRNRRAQLPPPGYLFKIGGVKQKNDKGSFVVPTVELGRKATPEEISACLNWFKLVKKGAIKVDTSDEGGEDIQDLSTVDVGDDGTPGMF